MSLQKVLFYPNRASKRTRWNGENNRIGQKTVVLAEDGQEIKI